MNQKQNKRAKPRQSESKQQRYPDVPEEHQKIIRQVIQRREKAYRELAKH